MIRTCCEALLGLHKAGKGELDFIIPAILIAFIFDPLGTRQTIIDWLGCGGHLVVVFRRVLHGIISLSQRAVWGIPIR